ncbi:1719_t:CDS:2 [Ambispora leptoticha]|uniref:1719_t:CDS:1 n=1 Tax=Ambispora leptoticha TaxID=144679 RepID=A0A9N9G2T9_9GLOM|nr:1719_t:CDS:2 [Ambispora leptoticha]
MTTTYSDSLIIWLIFQLINVILLLFLGIQFAFKRKHYTLANLGFVAFIDCIVSTSVALVYGDELATLEFATMNTTTNSTNTISFEPFSSNQDKNSSIAIAAAIQDNTTTTTYTSPPSFCIAQSFILYFTHLCIGFWTFCLMINLWLLIVKGASDVEIKWFKVYIIFAWLLPLILTCTAFIILREQSITYGVSTSLLFFCSIEDGVVRIVTNNIPFALCAIIGLGLGTHASCTLINYRTRFLKQNSLKSLAIPMGLCVRMVLFCLLYLILFIFTSVKPAAEFFLPNDSANYLTKKVAQTMDAYVDTLIAWGLFLIFGTTRESIRSLFTCFGIYCWRCVDIVNRQQPPAPPSTPVSDLETPNNLVPSENNITLTTTPALPQLPPCKYMCCESFPISDKNSPSIIAFSHAGSSNSNSSSLKRAMSTRGKRKVVHENSSPFRLDELRFDCESIDNDGPGSSSSTFGSLGLLNDPAILRLFA